MIDFDILDINKYLRWYEELSKEMHEAKGNGHCIDDRSHGRKAIESETGDEFFMAFKFGLRGKNQEFGDWMKAMKKAEIEEAKFAEAIVREENGSYFPSSYQWNSFHNGRIRALEKQKAEFEAEFARSPYDENGYSRFVEQRLAMLREDIFTNHNYFDEILLLTPLSKARLNANATDGHEWGVFCLWVESIDFAKWLLQEKEKGKGQDWHKTTTPQERPTVAAVALFHYYLATSDEHGFECKEVLNAALLKYKGTIGSKKNLVNCYHEFLKDGVKITQVTKSKNLQNAQLRRFRFVIQQLKEHGNEEALGKALRDFEIVEKKINDIS